MESLHPFFRAHCDHEPYLRKSLVCKSTIFRFMGGPHDFDAAHWTMNRELGSPISRSARLGHDTPRRAELELGARAPVRAYTQRGASPRQAEGSPACNRRLLRRGDT